LAASFWQSRGKFSTSFIRFPYGLISRSN
jgi:hypothetical protein